MLDSYAQKTLGNARDYVITTTRINGAPFVENTITITIARPVFSLVVTDADD